MKSSLICLLLLSLTCLSYSTLAYNSYEGYHFEKFEVEYKKVYPSQAERSVHRVQFENNLKMIKLHNSNPSKTYTMAVNKFADLSKDQMKKYKGHNKNMSRADKSILGGVEYFTSNQDIKNLPVTVDWRLKGAVSPVKNQEQCGSCWAFATTETIESQLYLATGEMKILSPQNVLECTPNPLQCGGTGGCEGAIAELGFQWAESGIALESDLPYIGQDGRCNATVPKAAKTGGYVKLPSNDPNSLLVALANVGPVAVSVDASSWSFYSSGIYNGCNTSTVDIDHAVQAVGYGVDSTSGQGFWIIRNSWGPSWGESGFIRLYRGPNEGCGTDNSPSDGTACKGDNTPQHVCGTCGVWFDSSYPTKVSLV